MKRQSEIKQNSGTRFRQYSPMTLTLVVVVLLAISLLPSALNIPQSNPNTVPEYAPVPPDDQSEASNESNPAALGQTAQSSALTRAANSEPLSRATAGAQRRSSKRCVGNPPRQTEDPMSPPCVAFFDGNNGGATYTGVTRDEIVVLIYWDGGDGPQNTGDGVEELPPRGYCDIDLPPNTGGPTCWEEGTEHDFVNVRWARAYSRYFNERYQTYNRHVHFWGYFGDVFTSEEKRAVAAEHYQKLKPFAVFDQTIFSGNDAAYLDAMAKRGVMIFRGSSNVPDFQPAALYQKYAPQVWDFAPDAEHWAEHYVNYICTKIAGHPVSHTDGTFADGRTMRGHPRNYAFLSTADETTPGFQYFAAMVKSGVRSRCGVHGIETYFDYSETAATQNIARMKTENVTTILSLGGVDGYTSWAGDAARYYPEIVYAGDQELEGNSYVRAAQQSQNWMRNASVVTNVVGYSQVESDPRFVSCKEGDPNLSKKSCAFGNQFQRDYYMLFGAIQVAGPRLNPRTVDRGFHSIPAVRSTSPFVASCFFDPGDYTCVKDAMHEWWDPDGQASSALPGCWRMINRGRRYLANQWEQGDDVFPNTADACNAYGDGRTGVFEP